ncbi:MAG: hypothetical protein J6M53_05070 [Bacteroidaceae bacterium]|nr:hypothetical protein [Bacteroidaceae bacterium]
MDSKTPQWQWQQAGTSWKGVGIYHVTLTIPSREPLLGRLVIPDGDAAQARGEATELGCALLDCLRALPRFNPEIKVLQYSLMPDHLHSIWYVQRPMEKSIRYVAQGFWRAAKKAGRAWSWLQKARLDARGLSRLEALQKTRLLGGTMDESAALASLPSLSSIAPAKSRENPLRELLGGDVYAALPPLFTEFPFLRPLSRRGQLQTMIRYVQLNPQRLATKRLKPGFFRVQEGIELAGRSFSGVGNAALLQAERFAAVHVRRWMVEKAERGETQELRDYMNGCVLAARQGEVMVSPFISPQERQVREVLLKERHPFIELPADGFRDYYKPSGELFEAVAAGRCCLVLGPTMRGSGTSVVRIALH